MSSKGKFVVVEGIDGSGKSTISKYVCELMQRKSRVLYVHYPDYNSPYGKIIKDYLNLKTSLDPASQFFTYFADIKSHQTLFEQYLKDGISILCDRYYPSTYAYQCSNGFNEDLAEHIFKATSILKPDMTFLVDTSVDKAQIRMRKDNRELDIHEDNIDLQERVSFMYQKLTLSSLLSKEWFILNGNDDLEDIFGIIQCVLGIHETILVDKSIMELLGSR